MFNTNKEIPIGTDNCSFHLLKLQTKDKAKDY